MQDTRQLDKLIGLAVENNLNQMVVFLMDHRVGSTNLDLGKSYYDSILNTSDFHSDGIVFDNDRLNCNYEILKYLLETHSFSDKWWLQFCFQSWINYLPRFIKHMDLLMEYVVDLSIDWDQLYQSIFARFNITGLQFILTHNDIFELTSENVAKYYKHSIMSSYSISPSKSRDTWILMFKEFNKVLFGWFLPDPVVLESYMEEAILKYDFTTVEGVISVLLAHKLIIACSGKIFSKIIDHYRINFTLNESPDYSIVENICQSLHVVDQIVLRSEISPGIANILHKHNISFEYEKITDKLD